MLWSRLDQVACAEDHCQSWAVTKEACLKVPNLASGSAGMQDEVCTPLASQSGNECLEFGGLESRPELNGKVPNVRQVARTLPSS